jgi:hypothetical protein
LDPIIKIWQFGKKIFEIWRLWVFFNEKSFAYVRIIFFSSKFNEISPKGNILNRSVNELLGGCQLSSTILVCTAIAILSCSRCLVFRSHTFPTPLGILLAFLSAAPSVHLILAAHRPKISSKLFLISSSWPDQIAQLPVTVFHCSCRRPVRVSPLISLLVRVAIALALLSSFSDLTFRPVAVAEKWRIYRLWIDQFLGTTRTTYVRSDPWSLPEVRIADSEIMC